MMEWRQPLILVSGLEWKLDMKTWIALQTDPSIAEPSTEGSCKELSWTTDIVREVASERQMNVLQALLSLLFSRQPFNYLPIAVED